MQRRWRPLLLTLLAMLFLGGCVRAEADLTVSPDGEISGTILFATPLTEASDAGRAASAAAATAIEGRVVPGLRDLSGVSAAAVEREGWYGSELTLTDVPIADLLVNGAPLITQVGEEYVLNLPLDTSAQPDVPVAAADGTRAPGADLSVIRLSIEFPGVIEETNGTVEGSAVTWQTTYDQPLVASATAATTPATFPEWIWKALIWGVGGLVALAIAGLITVGIRSRND